MNQIIIYVGRVGQKLETGVVVYVSIITLLTIYSYIGSRVQEDFPNKITSQTMLYILVV